MNGVILVLLLQIMISSALRINRLQSFFRSRARVSTMMSKDWPTYLVEFRCTDPAFRFQEFRDIARGMKDGERIAEYLKEYTVAIPDPVSPENPVSCYVKLPSDDIARDIVLKSATVKRIIDVWGEGRSINEMCTASIETFHQRVRKELEHIPDLRWKLQFERYGREGKSGMDPAEKEALLDQIHDVCILVGGTVDLKKPNMNLIYYEDWHTYHRQHIALTALMKTAHEAQLATNATNDPSISTPITIPSEPYRPEKLAAMQVAQTFTPLKYFFGRVIGEGPGIFAKFDLRARPFVGTTSMNAMCSHISASAAQVKKGDKVLDPFCGTGSLLVAAAYLGANVVGSDIDADGLLGGGMIPLISDNTNINDDSECSSTPPVRGVLPPNQRSKNVNFTRKGGRSQLGLCTMDNFKHYKLHDRVLDLIGAGVDQWLLNKDGSGEAGRDPKILKYDKFDAIIADPPFGRREKMTPAVSLPTDTGRTDGHTDCNSALIQPLFTPALNMGKSNSELITTLLRVAKCRLVSQGKLVLWLPTKAETEESVVMEYLNTLITVTAAKDAMSSGDARDDVKAFGDVKKDVEPMLRLERVTAETLNDSLWRWLCVFKLD